MKTPHILYIMAAFVAMSLTGCSSGKENSTAEHGNDEHEHTEEAVLTQSQIKTVGITLGHTEMKELGSVVRSSGTLRLNPQDMSAVTPLVSGIVRRLTVVEGQDVKAGQTVAYIENTAIVEMQKDYLVAVSENEMARQELDRQKTLASQGAGIQKSLQQATAAYATTKARVTGLSYQLSQIGVSPHQTAAGHIVRQIPVRAAISGTVSRILVNTDSYADTSAPIMQIANNAAVFASLNVFERDVAKIRAGQKADIVVTNNPAVRIRGTVARVNRSIDPATKAIEVHVRLDGNTRKGLIAGMYVTGNISTGKSMVTALPSSAIVSAEGKSYVFVLDGTTATADGHATAEGRQQEAEEPTMHFKRAEVVTGVSELGYTQVSFVSPIQADATIVTGNAFYLASMTADHGEH